jgi:exosortase E/protease (VPEID-CTERM system)
LSRRAWIVAALAMAELAGLALAYQLLMDFQCSASGSELTCRFLRSLVARAIVVLAALALLVWLRRPGSAEDAVGPLAFATTSPTATFATGRLGPSEPGPGWLSLHLAGVALLLYPLLLATAYPPDAFLGVALPIWLAGVAVAAAGAVLWIAPLAQWRIWLARAGYAPWLVALVAFVVPDLTRLVQPLWNWQPLAAFTFGAVLWVLSLLGTETYSDPATYVIGLEDFYVEVGEPCSGVEGFALIGGFIALYGFLFRQDLRFPRYWIVVLPLGLAASWVLNTVRIAGLILIGARISPELAVESFHSYAGWMFFTLLALSIIWLVHATPALHLRPGRKAGPGLREDWLAARILPMSAFFVTGLFGAALTPDAELAAPYRALALAAALAFFSSHWRELRLSRDPLGLASGLAVGVLWVATEPAPPNAEVLMEALAGYGSVALAAWIVLRVLGTALLVPIAEELFFRGYLLGRLDFGGPAGRAFAILVSSGLFAALHSRWMEACAAGIVFALVMLRRNRLGDAVIAHVAANSVIALSAVLRGDWAAI